MEDKFKLDKLNIYLIIVAIIVFIILVITCIRLANSNKNSESKLPILETTAGNTSTSYTTTTTTTITTTIDYASLNSPYYSVDTNILTDELYRNNTDLTNDDCKKIVEDMLKYANAVYDTNDFSIFNTDLINKAAKEGETDKIVVDGLTYAELYNYDAYAQKLFYPSNTDYLKIFYKGANVIIKKNGKYYRLITDINYNYKVNIITIKQAEKNRIKAVISYVLSNNPNVYKGAEITLEYDNGWKVKNYVYPM